MNLHPSLYDFKQVKGVYSMAENIEDNLHPSLYDFKLTFSLKPYIILTDLHPSLYDFKPLFLEVSFLSCLIYIHLCMILNLVLCLTACLV